MSLYILHCCECCFDQCTGIPAPTPRNKTSCLKQLFQTEWFAMYSTFKTLRRHPVSKHQLQARVLKACADVLAVPLTDIFNQASSKKLFLATENTTKLSPYTRKETQLALVTNYRPISLLPILLKVLETLVYNKVITFIRPNINKQQFEVQIQFIPNALLPLGRSQ